MQNKYDNMVKQNEEIQNECDQFKTALDINEIELNKQILMNGQLNNDKNELIEKLNKFQRAETEQNIKNNQLIENEKIIKNTLKELENKYDKMKANKNDLTLKLKQLDFDLNNSQNQYTEILNKYNIANNKCIELKKEKQQELQIKTLELEMINIRKRNKELIIKMQ